MSDIDRWLPGTYQELRDALQRGVLVEGPRLELKREKPPDNWKLARSLAALAVDGGVLIIGVDEKGPALHPVPLHQLKEHVDQVARNNIDEPLRVRTHEIHEPSTPGDGFLVVEVPESPQAPHQVPGRGFYARRDTTNEILSAADLERLIGRRVRDQTTIVELLRGEIARDPVPEKIRRQAHLYAVARPVSWRREMLLEALGDQERNWIHVLNSELFEGKAGEAFHTATPVPLDIPRAARSFSRRARGWALHTHELEPGRFMHPDAAESLLLDLEVNHDGMLRLFCGHASRPISEGQGQVAIEAAILGLTKRLMLIAGNVAETCDFRGSWDVGVAVTGLRGKLSARLWETGNRLVAAPYSEDEHFETVRVTWDELTQDPDRVVDRLLRALNLALNGGVAPIPSLQSEYA
ncbi:MAG: ATP-binding protein [Actinomycetota bacterium]|nr:ATP-binding protein [Actinomycetota bacterium]